MATSASIHPGGVLIEDFIEPMGVIRHGAAIAVGVSPRRINELNLQARYDLEAGRGVDGGPSRQAVGRRPIQWRGAASS